MFWLRSHKCHTGVSPPVAPSLLWGFTSVAALCRSVAEWCRYSFRCTVRWNVICLLAAQPPSLRALESLKTVESAESEPFRKAQPVPSSLYLRHWTPRHLVYRACGACAKNDTCYSCNGKICFKRSSTFQNDFAMSVPSFFLLEAHSQH